MQNVKGLQSGIQFILIKDNNEFQIRTYFDNKLADLNEIVITPEDAEKLGLALFEELGIVTEFVSDGADTEVVN